MAPSPWRRSRGSCWWWRPRRRGAAPRPRGCLYTLGGIVYAAKRPNPSRRWSGFHEVFHLLTVVAWVTQYVAVSFVTYRVG
ncbi:MAG: hemolysin III family protein [Micromonosporaceae bacterium]